MASRKIIERIARLQKLAGNNPEPLEAEAAAAQALRLQIEHAVSQAEIDASLREEQDPLVEQNCYFTSDRLMLDRERMDAGIYLEKTANWKRLLAFAIVHYLGIRAAFHANSPYFDLYGHLSDCTAARELYTVCARQIIRQGAAWLAEEKERRKADWESWTPSEARSAGFAFKESAIKGLKAKFAELAAESVEAQVEGTALVRARKQEVAEWVEANYSFGKSVQIGGDVGWNTAGFEAGKALSLIGDKVLGDGRRALGTIP